VEFTEFLSSHGPGQAAISTIFAVLRIPAHRLATCFDGWIKKQIQFLPRKREGGKGSSAVFSTRFRRPKITTFVGEFGQKERFCSN
jgi:hypothetical protein